MLQQIRDRVLAVAEEFDAEARKAMEDARTLRKEQADAEDERIAGKCDTAKHMLGDCATRVRRLADDIDVLAGVLDEARPGQKPEPHVAAIV